MKKKKKNLCFFFVSFTICEWRGFWTCCTYIVPRSLSWANKKTGGLVGQNEIIFSFWIVRKRENNRLGWFKLFHFYEKKELRSLWLSHQSPFRSTEALSRQWWKISIFSVFTTFCFPLDFYSFCSIGEMFKVKAIVCSILEGFKLLREMVWESWNAFHSKKYRISTKYSEVSTLEKE